MGGVDSNELLRGIITVLNTPFTEDDRIDLAGLQRHVALALDAGVSGFLVPALAGEVGSLTGVERESVVTAVLEATGATPVIGGAAAPTQAERVRLAARLGKQGCRGVLVNMPLGDEDEFEADLREIATAARPAFVMLQDWDPHGAGLPVPFIRRLFESIPAFEWLKIEVIPAGPKYTAVLEATHGRLNVAGGWAVMQMIEALDRGVHAFMPTALHRAYGAIYSRYASGDRDGAREVFERILPILAFTNQELGVSIQFFKRLLHAQGVYATDRVRPPVKPLDMQQVHIARELIERAIQVEAGI